MKEKLQKVLEKAYPHSDVKLLGYDEPSYGGGLNHKVFMVSFRKSGKKRKVVVKTLSKRKSGISSPRVFLLGREAGIIRKLNACASIRTSKILYFDGKKKMLGSPFLVMECAEGKSFRELLDRSGGKHREQYLALMLRTLGNLHATRLKEFGFLATKNFAKYILKDLERANKVIAPYAKKESRFAQKTIRKLWNNLPGKEDRALLNGDIGPAHFYLDKKNRVSIIDWDSAIIGDRSWDFFYMMHGAARKIFGVGERKMLKLYEDITGHKLQNAQFYRCCSLLMSFFFMVYFQKNRIHFVPIPRLKNEISKLRKMLQVSFPGF